MISILMFWWMVCYYWCRSGGPLSPDRAWEIGSMLPEPPLETRNLVLWFSQSRDPRACSAEDTSEFRPRAAPRDFVIRVSSHPHQTRTCLLGSLHQGKDKPLLSQGCLKEVIRCI